MAGGFLVKDAGLKSSGGAGRWDPSQGIGALYNKRYGRSSLLEALSEWESMANKADISKAALAYRWVT